MVLYLFVVGIPMALVSVFLWILYLYLVMKHKEAERQPMRSDDFAPVFVIPVFEESLRDEEAVGAQDVPRLFPYRDTTNNSSRGVTPPPPYGLEAPPYEDPPPSYWDPPAYSELQ